MTHNPLNRISSFLDDEPGHRPAKDQRHTEPLAGQAHYFMALCRQGEWTPKHIEDTPRRIDFDHVIVIIRSCELLPVLVEVRRFNTPRLSRAARGLWAVAAWAATGSPGVMERWARKVTPLTYRVNTIPVPTLWRPAHMLDVPPGDWEDESETPRYRTLEAAAMRAAQWNRRSLDVVKGAIAPRWSIVLAVECEAIRSSTSMDCLAGAGLATRYACSRFHVVDIRTWPVSPAVLAIVRRGRREGGAA